MLKRLMLVGTCLAAVLSAGAAIADRKSVV